MPATEKGKAFALKALAERREKNAKIEHVDNASLYAGSPMYFYCIGCGAEMCFPEDYLMRSDFCAECLALKACGWLE